MKTSERIFAVAGEIDAVLRGNDVAVPNAHAINRLRGLCGQLGPYSSYAEQQVVSIYRGAEVFYSERRHWNWPGGADRLYAEMLFDLLAKLRNEGDRRANAGD